jgi:glycopeptide antibiotics resistance protein
MFKTTSSRLSLALLGYVILVILFLTLNPFYLSIPDRVHIEWFSDPGDVITNIILFLPVGFLYRMITKRRGAWLLGAFISTGIEAMQLFIPARTTSPIDVFNNTLGAGLGAVIYDLFSSRLALTPKVIGRLRLDTPLMGFIYLLIPLLWIDSLLLVRSSGRWPLMFLIGICGAVVFNDVYRHWLEAKGLPLILYTALSTGGWFLFGTGISFLRPFPSAWVTLAVVTFAILVTLIPRQVSDRRFERDTLRWLIPIFALYILLLALWPINRPLAEWHGIFGLTDRIQDTERQGLLTRIEYLVAFSILGYLAAEWHGRAELSMARDIPKLLAVTGGAALALEILVGFQSGMGASLVRFVLVTSAALYGGMIYHLMRAHIRYLYRSEQKKP